MPQQPTYGVDITCSDCLRGDHLRCDGEAWNDNFECVVDCACPVCCHIAP